MCKLRTAGIQQIIADNSLLDPCNPSLTSKDILNMYANGNCSDNLGSKSIDGILNDIINSWNIEQIIDCMDDINGFDIDDAVEENINECEKELIKKYPFAAIKINQNMKKAKEMALLKFGFQGRNDCCNAFRHAYFNVLNAKSVGISIAGLFSDAHECDTPSELINESTMDLYNNSIGLNLGEITSHSEEVIADLVCNALSAGQLKVLEIPENSQSNIIFSYGCKCN